MPAFKKLKSGAPAKLDRDLINKISNVLRSGSYIETAVIVCGVSKQTFYNWVKESHKKGCDPIYLEFLDAVERAQEESQVRDLMNIDVCAMGRDWEYERDAEGNLIYNGRGNPIVKRMGIAPDWSASAWRLERRHSKHWSKTDKVELTGKDGGAIVSSGETEEEKKARTLRVQEMLKKLNALDKV